MLRTTAVAFFLFEKRTSVVVKSLHLTKLLDQKGASKLINFNYGYIHSSAVLPCYILKD
jgi:hypothetical protein